MYVHVCHASDAVQTVTFKFKSEFQRHIAHVCESRVLFLCCRNISFLPWSQLHHPLATVMTLSRNPPRIEENQLDLDAWIRMHVFTLSESVNQLTASFLSSSPVFPPSLLDVIDHHHSHHHHHHHQYHHHPSFINIMIPVVATATSLSK
mmetsp:Transcript_18062/g.25312  ORF Transcript_18062/g.25312 Transcript_18062/m.25312 type:complete len:149 (+) Transcript_18062:108-554(+)